MKNTFMDGIRYDEKHGPKTYGPQVRKLRQDFNELIKGNVPEEDVVAYVRRLMEQPQNFGKDGNALVWALGKPTDMPSDGCEEFICQPTYLATGFMVYAVQHYNAVKTISGIFPLLRDALNVCLWGSLGGHGYEAVEGLIDTMNLFADCNMGAFLDTYPMLNVKFKNVFDETVKYFEEDLCTGKERDIWSNKSYEDVAIPPLKKLKSTVPQQLLFVYGTLMRSGRAENLLSGSEFKGKAILKNYAIYDLGSYPGIAVKKGAWVEGELYAIRDSAISRLDEYEGEGYLYRRELITVESGAGSKQAWAYVYLRETEGEAMNEPWIKNDEDAVWYAGYGSNLSKERFLCYIKGGVCQENGREYPGCANNQLVSDADDHAWFPGQMYFGNESGTWNHKGVAFYDPNVSGRTFMRMFKVTRQQLRDIQEQEGSSPKWYGRIQALGIHSDGSPIYTLTSETRRLANAPDETYISLIIRALIKENGFSENEANLYLAMCLNN